MPFRLSGNSTQVLLLGTSQKVPFEHLRVRQYYLDRHYSSLSIYKDIPKSKSLE